MACRMDDEQGYDVNRLEGEVRENLLCSEVMNDDEQGYDVNRFLGEVREDLLCSVCQDVPKDPRVCQNEDHIFCLAHISRHLHQNSHTCPVCRDPLTPETLKRPTRFLKNYLEDLKIKCDHHDRGCPDVVRLEDLQRHVDQCGFAPVMCGNEGCGTEVNRRDKENHEKNLCQFRIAKCHDCKDIKASQNGMKASQDGMKASQDEMKASQDEMKASQNEMKASQDEIKASQDEIKEFQSEVKIEMEEIERKQDEMKENVGEIKKSQDVINVRVNQMKENVDEIKQSQNDINDKVNQMKENGDVMKQSQEVINVKVNKMKDNVDEIKQTQAEMKADQMAFEAEARNQFGRMTEMLNQLLEGRNRNNNDAQALDPPVPVNNQDIIIIGGWYAPEMERVLNRVEKFNIVEGKSTQLPKLNHPRGNSASCLYNGDVIIAGGYDGQASTDSIEILKMKQDPLRWTMFDGKLPVKLSSHEVIIYQGKLYIIGGFNAREKKTTDKIYELSIIPPYTAKLLARMPQSRRNHRAEIVNGKLFILGGSTTNLSKGAIDSVVVYDFIKNELKPCPSLLKAVWGMSTVTWGNMVILIGGQDKNDQVLNEVTMYDIESGQSQKLPPLIHKRFGSSAVIMHDVIVVLGGWNKEEGHLNSLESFTMGGDHWRELPAMKEKRHLATAVVKPRN
ncbi:RING finger 151-like [Paramuricea clavata]|uniref:RING finger 151-like n=1 Tax=Paramuricea clavata TaxID=317549 RepID=A0A6S7GQK1_PARCT|nr:RING finger 151-like [Paramuricea clavata]